MQALGFVRIKKTILVEILLKKISECKKIKLGRNGCTIHNIVLHIESMRIN